jgi:MFS transporter, NNP family, nitrate/nitrite transporter
MNNAAALYFHDEFGQSTESAAAIASLFGWMNLFARGIGGYASDLGHHWCGLRGRLLVQAVCLIAEGLLVFCFEGANTLSSAIVCMIFFSLLVQAAEGSTYGIVPEVDPPATGAISGIVGAGGNIGGVCFGLLFRQLDYYNAFFWMGVSILFSSVLTLFICIPGQNSLLGCCCCCCCESTREGVKTHPSETRDDKHDDSVEEGETTMP